MAYIGSSPTKVVSRQSANIFTYTATANQTAFTGSDANGNTLACTPSDIMVHMNGLRLEESDYTASTTTVTLGSGAAAGDEVTITAFVTFESADHYTKSAADTRYVNATGDTMSGDLTVDTDTLKVDSSNNRVGMGTASPSQRLHVEGTGNQFILLNNSSTNDGMYLKAGTGASSIQTNGGSHVLNFFTSGTERLKIDSSGRVTKPNQPSFKAMGSSNQYLDASPIEFPTVSGYGCHNIGSHYNTSNYRFTAPIAARYFFHVHIGIIRINATTAACYPQLRINGAQTQYSYIKMTGSIPDYVTAHLSAVLNLAASDYVDVTFVGGSNSQYYNGPTESTFQGYLVG